MKPAIMICINLRPGTRPSCAAMGSEALLEPMRAAVQAANLDIDVQELRCFGECEKGPNVRIAPGGPFYRYTKEENIPEIIEDARSFIANNSEDA
uniref:Putative ferredoxin, 2Fe-2S n=1 Tax=Magnetococcus massalia (strain MO-1) TaxID=451514 RepID=A0A1S7LJ76_MAGMO|nr:putative ferredoxin, 2Fe-2S [Candidatus Magnetococcus massalia]